MWLLIILGIIIVFVIAYLIKISDNKNDREIVQKMIKDIKLDSLKIIEYDPKLKKWKQE